MTSAIVIAVLLPIGICGFCLLLKLRQNAAEKREDNYYDSGTNRNANQRLSSRPMDYEPNITNSGPGTNRSSTSSGKKKIGRGDSSDDRDSGIQTTEVKLHDDGRVTALERDQLQKKHDPKNSPISSLKNGAAKDYGNPDQHKQGGGSNHGSLSGGSRASRQPSKDEFLLDLENDRGENEMVVGNPTFNEVVARRSPVGRAPSIGSTKNSHQSPSVGSGSSSKGSNPRVPLPTGITSSSDSSNLPSSARSSSRSNLKEGGITAVPLQKQTGPTLVGKDRYPDTIGNVNESDASMSPAPSDARYDGVYYTREPLNDKPREDFPTKTMDVDIDFGSYKPHGSRPSAL